MKNYFMFFSFNSFNKDGGVTVQHESCIASYNPDIYIGQDAVQSFFCQRAEDYLNKKGFVKPHSIKLINLNSL